MNWRQATLGQLYEIAYNDAGAPLQYKQAALEEIRRRMQKRHARVNYKERKGYPR
jgi:hypothetical protein